MQILVDMDDVLENLSEAWIACLNEEYGLHVDYRDARDWKMELSFPELTPAQIYAPLYSDEFWHTVRPIPGAAEALEKLMEDGHEIYVVTASNYVTIKTKMEEVLFKYYPFLDWRNVIVAFNKQMIRGDVLIDDAPHNLIGGDYIKILLDAPHNRRFDAESNGMFRAKDWADVIRILSYSTQKRPFVGVKKAGR